MGCFCSKGAKKSTKEHDKGSRSSTGRVVSFENDAEPSDGPRRNYNAIMPVIPISNNLVAAQTLSPINIEEQSPQNSGHQRSKTVDIGVVNVEGCAHVPKVRLAAINRPESEHDASDWPVWLASVAGDALKGWIPRRIESFQKIEKIGEGTYSTVYKARDLEKRVEVSLKQVRFVNNDPESVRFMAREIIILRKLNHPNIIKLKGLIVSNDSTNLHLVFDYMEHDLAGLLADPNIAFTESQIKCYMRQLFRGLNHCHKNGVLHRDIKGSNLLIDNNGILRIADFGLAAFFGPNWKQPLTSRVVTLWYRAPELLLGSTEYGVSVDLWSAGCILAEIFKGRPIMTGRTEVEQLHKIFKICGSPPNEYFKNPKFPNTTIFKPVKHYKRCLRELLKDIPSTALNLTDSLLAITPEDRGTTDSALSSKFFTTQPYACDPSSLPSYPPSKEMDVKLRSAQPQRPKEVASKEDDPSGNQRNRIKDSHQPKKMKGYGPDHELKMRISQAPPQYSSETSESRGWNNQLVDMPSTSYTRIEPRIIQEPLKIGKDRKIPMIDYSGPLRPHKVGVEVMLEEHDRKIRDAARQNHLDRGKGKMQCIE